MSNGNALTAFGEWVLTAEWREDFFEFQDLFTALYEELTGHTFTDVLQAVDNSARSSLLTVLMESFLADHRGGKVLKDFRTSGQMELNPSQLSYLKEIAVSTPSIYEVQKVATGSHIVLKDMIVESPLITVRERSASIQLAKWDLLLTRVVSVKGVLAMSGGTLLLPREQWPFLSAEIKRQFKEFLRELPPRNREDEKWIAAAWEETATEMNWYGLAIWLNASIPKSGALPTVVNKDGDVIEFLSLAYPIRGDTAAISQALDAAKEFERTAPNEWTWLLDIEGESIVHGVLRMEGERLLAECNSVKRSQRLTHRLFELAGDILGAPIQLETSLAEAAKMTFDPEPSLMETLGPEEQEQLAQQLQRMVLDQYMRTIDGVVPMLGGCPRDLVRTKAGREKVANWLKMLENHHARSAGRLEDDELDFTPLWQTLGLLKLRS